MSPGNPPHPHRALRRGKSISSFGFHLALAIQVWHTLHVNFCSRGYSMGRTMRHELSIHGRGAAVNPPNRFERLAYEPDPDVSPDDRPAPTTQFFRDASRTIIAYNDSPDIPFSASLNP